MHTYTFIFVEPTAPAKKRLFPSVELPVGTLTTSCTAACLLRKCLCKHLAWYSTLYAYLDDTVIASSDDDILHGVMEDGEDLGGGVGSPAVHEVGGGGRPHPDIPCAHTPIKPCKAKVQSHHMNRVQEQVAKPGMVGDILMKHCVEIPNCTFCTQPCPWKPAPFSFSLDAYCSKFASWV